MSAQLPVNLDLFASPDLLGPPEITQSIELSAGEERSVIESVQRRVHPAIRELLGEAVTTTFERTFRQIEMASEAIEGRVRRHPDHTATLNSTFKALRWQLGGYVPDQLYRAHVEEVLQRVLEQKSLEPGTRAEVLIALHRASMRGPLVAEYAALFDELFVEIFGADAIPGSNEMIREPWKNASHDLLRELRQRIRIPSRD